MRQLSTLVLILLTLLLAAIYLPMAYEKAFFKPAEKTHLLFSPVTQRFIYKEKIVGTPLAEAMEKAEDHHAEIAYRDADGTWYSRVEFEKRLPFIYYKNMELWGLLPIESGGRSFDAPTIKRNRQVLQLTPGEINGHHPETPLWPLIESNPGQARLVFPEDRFRMTAEAMEFINADTNAVDQALTTLFTRSLQGQGFLFPARSVNGKFTILKPFDEGVFLVDRNYQVFHVKRMDGRPLVVKTGVDPALATRHIKISENRRRQSYGLLLAGDGRLFLLTYDNYRLIPLPVERYDPDRMDFKLLINPLYLTAVWSDDKAINAVAMDTAYRPLDRYVHRMSRATITPMQRIYQMIFPFTLHLGQDGHRYLSLSFKTGGLVSLIGLVVSLAVYLMIHRLRHQRLPGIAGAALVAVTGIYGLIGVGILESGHASG